jgi:tetratricopeptide (TPR) repeat protein
MKAFQVAAIVALGSLGATGVAWGAAAEQEEDLDVIVRTDKVTIGTKVEQDDYVQVTGKRGAAPAKVYAYQVKDVIRADRDANYSQALEKRGEGRYRLAMLYFQKALAAMTTQKWAAEYCNYGLAESLYEEGLFKGYTGKSGNAYSPPSVYYQKALAANPKTRFLPDILVKLPVCLAEEGKLDEAEAKLKEAEARLKAYRDETIKVHSGFGDVADRAAAQLAIAGARLIERKAAEGKAKWDDAKERYLSARFKAAKFPDAMGEAVDGLLRVLINMKDYNGAKAEAEGLVEKFKKESDMKMLPMLPAAYMVLGKANLAQAAEMEGRGAAIPSRSAYAEARWWFLHVVAQFFDNDEYVAQAYYFAGLCCDKLRELEPDAGEMAVRYWKRIVRNFPRSEFCPRAQTELNRVGAAPKAEPKAEPKAAPKAEAKAEAKPEAAAPKAEAKKK